MPSTINIKDLATMLNVSPSTISKALSDSPEISLKTKEKVREMAKKTGYIPNHYAQSLKSKMTKTIGVVVPNVLQDYFAKVLHGIEKEASKYGFTVLITFSNDKKKSEYDSLMTMINHKVDGILISYSEEIQKSGDYTGIKRIMEYGVPIVMFDRINKDFPFDSVTINDFEGARRATQYLLDSGCKKVAFLSPISNTSVGRSRWEGYLAALSEKENGPIAPICINIRGYDNFRTLFESSLVKHEPDGILAADELSAIYCLNTLQRIGYKVPKEISVIGFTDGPMAKSANPTLSIVSQHAEEVGAKSFQLLRYRLTNGFAKTKNVVIDPELFLRESTKITVR